MGLNLCDRCVADWRRKDGRRRNQLINQLISQLICKQVNKHHNCTYDVGRRK
nr:MAG TPA: hypothetical protein [Caudoviricetes sp.]